ncbi:hypothetical protein HanIR_Chr17g0875921 [Helianthus annuus]|nr:hypothetical protein HanIR_Chr17g0875921 [Helianthus annuus]
MPPLARRKTSNIFMFFLFFLTLYRRKSKGSPVKKFMAEYSGNLIVWSAGGSADPPDPPVVPPLSINKG